MLKILAWLGSVCDYGLTVDCFPILFVVQQQEEVREHQERLEEGDKEGVEDFKRYTVQQLNFSRLAPNTYEVQYIRLTPFMLPLSFSLSINWYKTLLYHRIMEELNLFLIFVITRLQITCTIITTTTKTATLMSMSFIRISSFAFLFWWWWWCCCQTTYYFIWQ